MSYDIQDIACNKGQLLNPFAPHLIWLMKLEKSKRVKWIDSNIDLFPTFAVYEQNQLYPNSTLQNNTLYESLNRRAVAKMKAIEEDKEILHRTPTGRVPAIKRPYSCK